MEGVVFTPASGSILAPGAGTDVTFTFISPSEPKQTFSGTIKVVNLDDQTDYCEFYTHLTTPKAIMLKNLILEKIFEIFPNVYQLFRSLLGY